MGIFANFYGTLACLLQGMWDIDSPPKQASSPAGKALISCIGSLVYDVYLCHFPTWCLGSG